MATDDAKPKLTYFDIRGLAEVARLMFAAAGVEYVDNRLSDISELKKSGKLPYSQVPILEVNGEVIAQSAAIYRYIAREHGLYGSSSLEAAKIDMICEGVNDIRGKHNALRSLPEDKKAEETEKFTTAVLPTWMGHFEKLLSNNHEGKGFFVGEKISMADIMMQNCFFIMKPIYPSMLNEAPLLQAHYERVSNYPGIAAWLKKRPVTSV